MQRIHIIIPDMIGLTGVMALLIGYFMLNTGRWQAMSLTYQFFNFMGALLILISLFFHWNLSAATIEVCWMIISLIGIYRCVKR